MTDLWYRELGFYNNPFSIKPAAYTNEVIGQNLAQIFKRIEGGKPVFVLGPYGTGKTTLLKHVIGRYGGDKKVIYFSCGTERPMDVEKLLRGAGGMMSRLAGGMPQGIIFLVDETDDIFPKDAADLLRYHQDGTIKSIVFVGTNVPTRKLPAGLGTALKGNLINTHSLDPADAITLVRRRVGKLYLLPDPLIKELHRRAKGNTRLLLEYCEEACRLAVARGLSKLGKEELDELFPAPIAARSAKPAAPKAERPKIRKVRRAKPRPVEQAIEEAVFEVEADAPVMEGMADIRENDPLPSTDMYESEMDKKKKKRK